ncbi:hypothetical protein [Streptomyces sp. UH6]|uniref:hypothetical protein n=1 Tax=Streptomyces sp. UH6 TaxID=2748379 RepID=UPI0015D4B13B|nr:hypothetical protein [Streptomyces sp. UH6]NYV73142.1 hypothetical protein [Streptomyces sp. UH6]
MGLFSRKSQPETVTVDMDVARRAGEAVNRGDLDEANRIVQATAHPREHAFAAFRFITDED